MLPFEASIQVFFLIFARLFALLASTTFWGSELIDLRFRTTVGFFAAILLYPLVQKAFTASFPVDWPVFWFWMMNNIFIGLILGFLISMFFSLFQIAGQFFSFQMGFSIAEILDPLTQEEMPLLGQMMSLMALMVFIAVNGHLLVIDLLQQSFIKVPLLDFSKDLPGMLSKSMDYFGYMFGAALQFSVTIMGSILIATLFIGLVAKAAPQINAMLFGFPVYVGLGFILLSFLSNNMTHFMGNYISGFFSRIFALFKP